MGPQYSAGSTPRRNENGPTAKAGSFTSPLSLILSCSLWALGGERVLLSKQCFLGGGQKEGFLVIKQCFFGVEKECFFVGSASWGGRERVLLSRQ